LGSVIAVTAVTWIAVADDVLAVEETSVWAVDVVIRILKLALVVAAVVVVE